MFLPKSPLSSAGACVLCCWFVFGYGIGRRIIGRPKSVQIPSMCGSRIRGKSLLASIYTWIVVDDMIRWLDLTDWENHDFVYSL